MNSCTLRELNGHLPYLEQRNATHYEWVPCRHMPNGWSNYLRENSPLPGKAKLQPVQVLGVHNCVLLFFWIGNGWKPVFDTKEDPMCVTLIWGNVLPTHAARCMAATTKEYTVKLKHGTSGEAGNCCESIISCLFTILSLSSGMPTGLTQCKIGVGPLVASGYFSQ
jgi:hypothetical protein